MQKKKKKQPKLRGTPVVVDKSVRPNQPFIISTSRTPADWAKYAFNHWLHSGEKDPSKLLESKMLEEVFLAAMTEERNSAVDDVVALLDLMGNRLPNDIIKRLQVLKGTKNVWKR